jgi:hypothetical protein
MYGIYWSKLKNIGAATTILQFEGSILQRVLERHQGTPHLHGYFLFGGNTRKIRNGTPVRKDATENHHDDGAGFLVYPAMTFGTTPFGGIHIWAWNFVFRTNIELVLWRKASFMVNCFWRFDNLDRISSWIARQPEKGSCYCSIVESFRILFFLPPFAYIFTWTANIPHLANSLISILVHFYQLFCRK